MESQTSVRRARLGRTGRNRRNRAYEHQRPETIDSSYEFIQFVQWMRKEGWLPCSKLRLSVFQATGRGLMAHEAIQPSDLLVAIPENLLITSDTVNQSNFGQLLKETGTFKCFSSQQLLALFLVYERHQGPKSKWHAYINMLPHTYTTPCYAKTEEVVLLPAFLTQKIQSQREKIETLYKEAIKVIQHVFQTQKGGYVSSIFTFEAFMWGWFTVNTRSVYMVPDGTELQKREKDCFALAPFLDLLNHACESAVKAGFNPDSRFYEIRTQNYWPKYSEVFINYGPHDNTKLYLEYGFIVPKNQQSCVPFTLEEVCEIVEKVIPSGYSTDMYRKKGLLHQNNFCGNLICTKDGLSWQLTVVIQVLSMSKMELENWQVVFRGDRDPLDSVFVKSVGLLLLSKKCKEVQNCLDSVREVNECSGSFQVALYLVEEYIYILRKALQLYS